MTPEQFQSIVEVPEYDGIVLHISDDDISLLGDIYFLRAMWAINAIDLGEEETLFEDKLRELSGSGTEAGQMIDYACTELKKVDSRHFVLNELVTAMLSLGRGEQAFDFVMMVGKEHDKILERISEDMIKRGQYEYFFFFDKTQEPFRDSIKLSENLERAHRHYILEVEQLTELKLSGDASRIDDEIEKRQSVLGGRGIISLDDDDFRLSLQSAFCLAVEYYKSEETQERVGVILRTLIAGMQKYHPDIIPERIDVNKNTGWILNLQRRLFKDIMTAQELAVIFLTVTKEQV